MTIYSYRLSQNLVSVTSPPIIHGYPKLVSELKAHVVLSVDIALTLANNLLSNILITFIILLHYRALLIIMQTGNKS